MRGNKVVSPPAIKHTIDETRQILDFTSAFFDKELQAELGSFVERGVKIQGGNRATRGEKPVRINLKERTRYENPAITSVAREYGVYNPESITVDTFDQMKKDPQISAGLAFIKMPILSLPWKVSCDNEEIARLVEFNMKRIWPRLAKSMLTAVEYGFASHEKVFKMEKVNITAKKQGEDKKHTYYEGRALLYKKVKGHHPDSLRVVLDDKDNFNGIVQTSTSGGSEVPLKKDKCFFFTHDEEFGNPFGKSRLVSAYKYWYWKEILYQFMLMYYERRGSPPVLAQAPPGQSTDDSGNRFYNLDLALDMASSLLSNSVVALPYEPTKDGNDNMWDIRYLLDDKRGEMFIQAINHLDSKIFRALWIPDSALGESGEGGSYGSASVQADLFLMALKGLVTDMCAAVNEQIIPILVQANFRPSERDDCIFEMEALDFNRKITIKEIFIEMLRNMDNMIQAGHKPKILPDLEKMAKVLEIPINVFDEEVEWNEDAVANNNPQEGVDRFANSRTGDGGKPQERAPRKGSPKVRQTRTSFTGTREVDRKNIKPGSKRADVQRAARQKLSEEEVEAVRDVLADTGIEEIYAPRPGAEGQEIPLSERLRYEMIKMAATPDGLKEVKKAILRVKIAAGYELVPNFEIMNFMEVIKALDGLPDFYVDVLSEYMQPRVLEE